MIKKICVALGASVALVSTPAVGGWGSHISNEISGKLCKYEAITINQTMGTINLLRKKEDKLLNQLAGTKPKSKQRVSIQNALEDIRRWQRPRLEELDRAAARWAAFCK